VVQVFPLFPPVVHQLVHPFPPGVAPGCISLFPVFPAGVVPGVVQLFPSFPPQLFSFPFRLGR
jgi:hypothetical protein